MITADTITDKQISRLWVHAYGTGVSDVNPDVMHECTVALNRSGDFTLAESEVARARCADIINAHAHDLVKTGDADASPAICDRNGEVVLAWCRRCHEGEGGLAVICPAVTP